VVATFPLTLLPTTTTVEQQLPVADAAIWDVAHVLFGSEHVRGAAGSQQQTACTTGAVRLQTYPVVTWDRFSRSSAKSNLNMFVGNRATACNLALPHSRQRLV
jgi:hypothetical protein